MSFVVDPVEYRSISQSQRFYLAYDGGASKLAATVFECGSSGDLIVKEEPLFTSTLPAKDFSNFGDIMRELRGRAVASGFNNFAGAGIGVAGPLNELNKTVCFTNRQDWGLISFQEIANELELPLVVLNDLEAWGNFLYYRPKTEDLRTLKGGLPIGRVQAVGAPGAGNNVSGVDFTKQEPNVYEFGHVGLPVLSEADLDLIKYLFKINKGGTACWEDVLSGPGLVTLYNYVLFHTGQEKSVLQDSRLWEEDKCAAIAKAAGNFSDVCAAAAYKIYARYLGAYVANISNATGAWNKIFLGGNARKDAYILHCYFDDFINGLAGGARKIRNQIVLPVDIIKNPQAPLIGTAYRTSKKLQSEAPVITA